MSVANESAAEAHKMGHEEHSGPMRYVIVWVALMVLTIVTVVTGHMHLAHGALALALVIASVKGAMVALYFMHLVDHQGANRVVFVTSMVFVALLLVFTLFDIGTRFRPAVGNATSYSWPVETPGQSGTYSNLPPDAEPPAEE
jgi:cytochrome c oxidase subunit IV